MYTPKSLGILNMDVIALAIRASDVVALDIGPPTAHPSRASLRPLRTITARPLHPQMLLSMPLPHSNDPRVLVVEVVVVEMVVVAEVPAEVLTLGVHAVLAVQITIMYLTL